MGDSLAGVALGAGAGTRLRPLSLLRPKVLCPVGEEPLIDHAIGRLRSVVDDVAVNAHERQPMLVQHLDHRVHRSEEHTSEPQSLMRISYAGFCLKNNKDNNTQT